MEVKLPPCIIVNLRETNSCEFNDTSFKVPEHQRETWNNAHVANLNNILAKLPITGAMIAYDLQKEESTVVAFYRDSLVSSRIKGNELILHFDNNYGEKEYKDYWLRVGFNNSFGPISMLSAIKKSTRYFIGCDEEVIYIFGRTGDKECAFGFGALPSLYKEHMSKNRQEIGKDYWRVIKVHNELTARQKWWSNVLIGYSWGCVVMGLAMLISTKGSQSPLLGSVFGAVLFLAGALVLFAHKRRIKRGN